jgi:hypothetical protein
MGPIAGFEATVIKLLGDRLAKMPAGTAVLNIGKHPLDPDSPFPYFEVAPKNPRAASIRGSISNGEGIFITVGQASSRELWIRGGNIFRGLPCEDEFLIICEALFTTHSSEDVSYDSRGRVLRSRLVLDIRGKKVAFSSNRRLSRLLRKSTKKHFSYEPYF